MSVNSSSLNGSNPESLYCFFFEPGSFIFTSAITTHLLLLLPLCIFILHHGLQLWRQKRSTSSAVTASHSDIITYHMVAMELIHVTGMVVCFYSIFISDRNILDSGGHLAYFALFGETYFHILTCVERYLAVVHPITYLSLRNQRGIRIRNISIACVWLICFVMMTLMTTTVCLFLDLCILILSLMTISFCSLSVLCVLIRPGPREQGGGRERVDQSKLRAFYTITSILGALVVRVIVNIVWYTLNILGPDSECMALVCTFWFNLPSSLVLPLLFLHRAGKLVCWKKN